MIMQWWLKIQYVSGCPFHKDHVLLKIKGVIIASPVHHIQQCLLVDVRELNQHNPDVNLHNIVDLIKAIIAAKAAIQDTDTLPTRVFFFCHHFLLVSF